MIDAFATTPHKLNGLPEPTASSSAPSSPASSAPHRKVLIADDDCIFLRALSMKLRSRGYDVVTAMDGPSALNTARFEKPDLILLDMNFPPQPDPAHQDSVAWDGLRVLEWLRRTEGTRHAPVIFITASDPAEYKARSLAGGASAFLPKPVDCDYLLALMRSLLGIDL
jgi:two-component system, OmpR family, KDP operon response regulator KdpE